MFIKVECKFIKRFLIFVDVEYAQKCTETMLEIIKIVIKI